LLGVELAQRESATSWREFVGGLRERGLHGVEFVVSDDHPGLKKAVMEVIPEAVLTHPHRTVHLLCLV
jgi:putative transposase